MEEMLHMTWPLDLMSMSIRTYSDARIPVALEFVLVCEIAASGEL